MKRLHLAIVVVFVLLALSDVWAALQPIHILLMTANPDYGATVSSTANAAGESFGIVGQIRIAGNASSKTISAAGSGKILWAGTALTYAAAGTTIRVGIQDVNTTNGLEDGTFDVYKEYVQGTDTLASGYVVSTMSSGTKTLSDGDLIAIVGEVTVRNGADSIGFNGTGPGIISSSSTAALGVPYGTIDTGSLAKNNGNMFFAVVKFDDGTLGWIDGAPTIRSGTTSTSFNSGTTPDEYAAAFSIPFKAQISGIALSGSGIASTDTFEEILYTDPMGTPSATVTVTGDPDVVGGNASANSLHFYHITPTTLSPGVTYAIALRPTSANSINVHYIDYSDSTVADILRSTQALQSAKLVSRTNQTGAFSVVSNNYIPVLAISVSALDDGIGGSSEHAYPFARFTAPSPKVVWSH